MADMDQELGALLARVLARETADHPARTDLRLDLVGSPLAGASNQTVLADLHWREAGREESAALAIRAAPKGAGIFPGYDIAKQHRCMARLAATEVKAPVVLGGLLPGDGPEAFVMRRIAGRYLADNPPYHASGWLTEAEPATIGAIWRNAMRELAGINRVDWRKHGFADLWDSAGYPTPLAQALAEASAHLAWAEAQGRPYPLLYPLLEHLRRHQPQDEPIALCWGDAKPGNLMIAGDSGEIVAVLDWEMAHLGNPVHDLAWWLILDDCLAEGLGIPKLAGTPPREELVAIWEDASGFSASGLDYYTGLGILQFAIIMHRVGTMGTEAGYFPPEAEYDRNNCVALLLEQQLAHWGLPTKG